MSTWQQHALSNGAISTQNQLVNSQKLNHGSNSTEMSDNLGDINHTSTLSGDFGMYKSMKCFLKVENMIHLSK